MLIGAMILQQAAIAARCTEVADQVVPAYRRPGSTYACTGWVARKWQAAWDGACVALGGDPADFRA